jgi:hypothetical protein
LGLLVTEELVRAIRRESSTVIQYWFGVTATTVWHWRKACGVTCWGTEGSRRLHQAVSENAAAQLRGKKRALAAIEKQIQTCAERRHKPPQKRWAQNGWQQWQLDLLGTASDAELAARFGRTVIAVRVMRNRMGRREPRAHGL